jgi:hypothetical protein
LGWASAFSNACAVEPWVGGGIRFPEWPFFR